MTPEQIAASLRSIPYGVGNKAADLIEQQVFELEALRAERDAALEQRDMWMNRAMNELGENLALKGGAA